MQDGVTMEQDLAPDGYGTERAWVFLKLLNPAETVPLVMCGRGGADVDVDGSEDGLDGLLDDEATEDDYEELQKLIDLQEAEDAANDSDDDSDDGANDGTDDASDDDSDDDSEGGGKAKRRRGAGGTGGQG